MGAGHLSFDLEMMVSRSINQNQSREIFLSKNKTQLAPGAVMSEPADGVENEEPNPVDPPAAEAEEEG